MALSGIPMGDHVSLSIPCADVRAICSALNLASAARYMEVEALVQMGRPESEYASLDADGDRFGDLADELQPFTIPQG